MIPVNAGLRKYGENRERLIKDRDQLWAEAVEYWKRGEELYLQESLEKEARERQEEYNDDSDYPMEDMLKDFLRRKLPADWGAWGLRRRRAYFTEPDPLDAAGTELRERVCAAEFICERLGRDMGDKEYKYLARKVSRLIEKISGWERMGVSKHVKAIYGTQKSFKRVCQNESGDDI